MKALIVDDDRTLADLLAFTLRREGFSPQLAFNAAEALRAFKDSPADVIILDVNLPGEPGLENGFDVCRTIREISDVPIILLTVRSEENDVIRGLNLGADDYVLKPFSPRQLVARVESVLRRVTGKSARKDAPYRYKDLEFNPLLRTFVRPKMEPVVLTRLEARLLDVLMLNVGQVLPAENLITRIWGQDMGSMEMLRQLVHRLRSKIEMDPAEPILIKNLPGVGYGFGI